MPVSESTFVKACVQSTTYKWKPTRPADPQASRPALNCAVACLYSWLGLCYLGTKNPLIFLVLKHHCHHPSWVPSGLATSVFSLISQMSALLLCLKAFWHLPCVELTGTCGNTEHTKWSRNIPRSLSLSDWDMFYPGLSSPLQFPEDGNWACPNFSTQHTALFFPLFPSMPYCPMLLGVLPSDIPQITSEFL